MKWLVRIGTAVAVLLAIAALVPLFVTLDDYVPLVEKELSARLKEPVSIDKLHASMFPVPHVKVEGIAVGAEKHIKVGKLTLQPDVWSLLGSRKVIRSVEFEDVALSQKSLASLLGLAQGDAGAGNLTVESVKLRNTILELEHSSFGPFDGEVDVESGGRRGKVSLATRDGALQARLTPGEAGYALEISAKSWTPPLGPAVRFDELKVKGVAKDSAAELSSIAAKLYGGTAVGQATVRWDKGVAVKGSLELKQVELKDAAALVSQQSRMSGKLDAKPVFSAAAPKVSQLDDTLRLETPFTVHNGVLHGVDLANAATVLAKGGSGGQTRFDELSGRMVRESKSYRFTQLRIASGLLTAQGHVSVAPSRALSGQLNTSVKPVGSVAAIPLTVAGTLDSPLVYPTAGALIGGVAGTAVLPGVGTAVGVRLGEVVEGLLGKKK